ncbi:MAG: glycoside hydrolase family 3 N-terminal domain-containing protein, partial [Bacteroidota bacterium]
MMHYLPFRHSGIWFILIISLFIGCHTNSSSESLSEAPFRDPTRPVSERISDLLNRMTVQEKVAQVCAIWQEKYQMQDEKGQFLPNTADSILAYGIGHITRPSEISGSGEPGRTAENEIMYTNDLQRYLVENTRLGIPAIMHEESLHGLAAEGATSWGQPISVASSWDTQMTRQLYAIAARQTRSRGAHLVLTPVVDICRDPRWGRVEETFGEDPFLSGEMGLAAVLGFQGEDDVVDSNEVLATLKHLSGHGQPEGGNNIAPAHVSERDLREIFLRPFKKIVQEGAVRNIMASYNEINGIPSHANSWMLNEVLRGEWGFDGVVVSDYFAVRELVDRHFVAHNLEEAAIRAISSGIDIELPKLEAFPFLVEAVESGRLDEHILDQAVGRILRQKFDLGLFENPYTNPERAAYALSAPSDEILVRQMGANSMILLQNEDQILPLNPEHQLTIAIIGPNADKELLGGYSDNPNDFITVRAGIEAHAQQYGYRTQYAQGLEVTRPGSWYKDPVILSPESEERSRMREAITVARQSDIIVLAIGGNELTSREAWVESHLGDRPSLALTGLQNELVDQLAATGKPIISLVFGGRPLDIRNVLTKSKAVLQCWYLGQETGHSVTDVLFGQVNPSGKLPISMPRSAGHIPVFYNHKPTARRGYLFE